MKQFVFVSVLLGALAACGGNDTSPGLSPASRQEASRGSLKQNATSYQNAVESLYVAYFGRPADPNGMANFEAALQAAKAPTDVAGLAQAYSTNAAVKNLIDSFGLSTESQALYGNGTTTQFVATIFNNVLGRQPAPAGSTFWINAIDSGQTSRGDAALSIMAGALSNTTTQGVLDGDLINNRLNVAAQFTAEVTTQNAVPNYSGSSAAASARGFLAQVTATTSASNYQNQVASAVLAIADAPGIMLLAGDTGGWGNANGAGPNARFNHPAGIVRSASGDLYIADAENCTIRKLDASGNVSIVAGTAGSCGSSDGTGTASLFSYPQDVTVDASGNLYVADTQNQTIRKITPTGVVTTFAGSAGNWGRQDGTSAGFFAPSGVAADSQGNIYVADTSNSEIRKITPSGTVMTFAGSPYVKPQDGVGTAAGLYYPTRLTVDSKDNIYVSDSTAIRKITPSGVVTTIAGSDSVKGFQDGTGTGASFSNLLGLAVDKNGTLYVADSGRIRKVTPGGVVTTLAIGNQTTTTMSAPNGIAVDDNGNLFITDPNNSTILEMTPTGAMSVIAGKIGHYGAADGPGVTALFNQPMQLAADSNGNVFVADSGNYTIRKIASNGVVNTIAGSTGKFELGGVNGQGNNAWFYNPQGIALDANGNIFVAESYNQAIRKIAPDLTVTSFAGQYGTFQNDGTGLAAGFSSPTDLAFDSLGSLYVIDYDEVRKVTQQAVVTTLLNAHPSDPNYPDIMFEGPQGICIDQQNNIYVVDYLKHAVYKINTSGMVSTYAGQPGIHGSQDGPASAATFSYPRGLAIDGTGNIYVADTGNSTIRKITPDGMVSTVAGTTGSDGIVIGPLPGGLSNVKRLAFDRQGNLYAVAQNAILKIRLPASQ